MSFRYLLVRTIEIDRMYLSIDGPVHCAGRLVYGECGGVARPSQFQARRPIYVGAHYNTETGVVPY